MAQDRESVQDFYAGRSVFITGATGFVGKVLVEKILRSTDVKNVYILIRCKRNMSMAERLTDFLASELFHGLQECNPEKLAKIVPIGGDMFEEELGISAEDQKLIFSTVSVVLHCAASIKLQDDLKTLLTANMLGTQRLLALSRQMKSLEAFIYVSTAYVNMSLENVDEVVYPTKYRPSGIHSMSVDLPADIMKAITPTLVGGYYYNYSLTKALTEQMLQEEATDLPVSIVRPSLVVSCAREPMPGWVEGISGTSGVVAAIGSGILRSLDVNRDCVADFIPVDIVCNLILAAAWKQSVLKPQTMSVYNCVSGAQNPLTWGRFVDGIRAAVVENPLENALWYPAEVGRSRNGLLEYCKEAFANGLVRLAGKRGTKLKRIQSKIAEVMDLCDLVRHKEWKFTDTNVQSLRKEMTSADQDTFDFGFGGGAQWNEYFKHYYTGVREYGLRQSTGTLSRSRKWMKKLYFFDQTLNIMMFLLMIVSPIRLALYYFVQ